jgi:aryl-alcohol dehydrogenase-like predicted oxidoreductase
VLRKGEAIAALETAKAKGYVRYLGYSGDNQAGRYAVESGAFDTLQTSISIADQEAIDLVLPIAREKGVGVIAKRPIANAAWKENHKPISGYHHVYWERLNKLRYDFIRELPMEDSVDHALRFTLSVPGVHTAIVGTTKPERWQENAKLVGKGRLSDPEYAAIRERWEEIAPAGWIGQT